MLIDQTAISHFTFCRILKLGKTRFLGKKRRSLIKKNEKNACLLTSLQNFKSLKKTAEFCHFECEKEQLFTLFHAMSTSLFTFLLYGFGRPKSVLGLFLCSLRKSDLTICIAILKTRIYTLAFSDFVTSDNLYWTRGHQRF